MTVTVEHLARAKKDLADAVAAFDTADDGNVSEQGRSLVEKLGALDDAATDSLLASLEDSELRDLVETVRQRAKAAREVYAGIYSPVRQFGHSVLFDVYNQSLVVRTGFKKAQGESFECKQDLEDTLLMASVIVKAVSEAMGAIDGVFNDDAKRRCIGGAFEGNLERIERTVTDIRRMFTLMSA